MSYRHVIGVLAVCVFVGAARSQDEKVFRQLTPEQLESTLKSAKIEFKKLADKKANTFFYDYRAKNLNLRLYYLDGKQLLVDTLFGNLPLEKVNDWNLGGKYSRVGLGKDDKGQPYTVVESRLNLKGGVTEAALGEFLRTFVEEAEQFDTYVRASLPRKDKPTEEKALTQLSAEQLEKILGDLKVKFTKVPLTGGNTAYHFEVKDAKVVLTNWGKDMMLEAKFAKLPVEKVNQYNLDRKFVRAVAYSTKKGDYTNLEMNLNILPGVTESIVRNFISVFEEDIEAFAGYIRKASE